jgi:hypothetical protein
MYAVRHPRTPDTYTESWNRSPLELIRRGDEPQILVSQAVCYVRNVSGPMAKPLPLTEVHLPTACCGPVCRKP